MSKDPSKCEVLMGAPLTGSWSITDSNLILMSQSNTSGLRTQLIKLSDQIMVLPGYKNYLAYVLLKNEKSTFNKANSADSKSRAAD